VNPSELRHRRRILLVTLTTLSWRYPPGGEPELVRGLRAWLGGWPGIGRIVLGMVRQGYDVELRRYGEAGLAGDLLPGGAGTLECSPDQHLRLSNMTPQASLLNEGIWVWLEKLVRDYAQTYGEVVVLTGSVLQSPIRTVPSGNIGIPRRYYKIILRTTADGTLESLTIVLPNLQRGLPLPPGSFLSGPKLSPAEADAYLAGHTASIREIENLTGIGLLPNLSADDLKEAVASELWPRN
jgi:DNA/RNA endonuclease G (NUC1)